MYSKQKHGVNWSCRSISRWHDLYVWLHLRLVYLGSGARDEWGWAGWGFGRRVVNVLGEKAFIKTSGLWKRQRTEFTWETGLWKGTATGLLTWELGGGSHLWGNRFYSAQPGLFTEQIQLLKSGFLTFFAPFLKTAWLRLKNQCLSVPACPLFCLVCAMYFLPQWSQGCCMGPPLWWGHTYQCPVASAWVNPAAPGPEHRVLLWV